MISSDLGPDPYFAGRRELHIAHVRPLRVKGWVADIAEDLSNGSVDGLLDLIADHLASLCHLCQSWHA